MKATKYLAGSRGTKTYSSLFLHVCLSQRYKMARDNAIRRDTESNLPLRHTWINAEQLQRNSLLLWHTPPQLSEIGTDELHKDVAKPFSLLSLKGHWNTVIFDLEQHYKLEVVGSRCPNELRKAGFALQRLENEHVQSQVFAEKTVSWVSVQARNCHGQTTITH